GFTAPEDVFLGLRLLGPGPGKSSPERGNDWDGLAILTPQAAGEGHGTAATAAPVPLNSKTTGVLSSDAPGAFFRVSLPKPRRLTAPRHAAGFGARLSLLDANGTLLMQSDGQSSQNPDPLIDEHLDGAAAGTTYYLEVEGLAGGTGAYMLTAQFVPGALPFQL